MIKKVIGLRTEGKPGAGANLPGKEIVGSITQAQLEEVASIKMPDLNANDVEAAKKIIAGTCRSMGVSVIG